MIPGIDLSQLKIEGRPNEPESREPLDTVGTTKAPLFPLTRYVHLGGLMEEEMAEVIRAHGWYAASVNDADPPFLYTIGLMEMCEHPELIIFGLDSDNAFALFAGLIDHIRNGHSYSENCFHTIKLGNDKHKVGFRRVHPTQHSVYLGLAMGYMRHIGRIAELEVMQVFWPDVSGRLPFETGCDLAVYNLQPRLDIGLTPREVRELESRWQ